MKVFYTTEIERKHNRRQQNNTQKRELVREDARGYLTSATLLAGMYLLEMMNKNYNDPAIAIYEYRLGIRALEKAEEAFRQRHKGYDETLVNLARFDMADCKGLQHAFSWLALQFIGSNPAYYGLHIDESKALSKDYTQLAEVLFPPGIDKKLFNLKL